MPIEGLQGRAVPNGTGPPARGTGNPAQVVVGANRGPRGTAVPNGPGPPAGATGSLVQAAVGAYGGDAEQLI